MVRLRPRIKSYIIALFLIACQAQGQGILHRIQAGYGLEAQRDSILKFRIHPATFKTIGDSLGYGNIDSVLKHFSNNTIAFVARANDIDTTKDFSHFAQDGFARSVNNDYDWQNEALFTADTTYLLFRVSISHMFAVSSTEMYSRDTTVGYGISSPWKADSIVRGEQFHCRYVRAQATMGVYPSGSPVTADIQQLSPFIVRKNSSGGAKSSNVRLIENRYRVPPLQKGSGSLPSGEEGFRLDHWLVVTFYFIPKVPGRAYW